jgi:hypothetical protein
LSNYKVCRCYLCIFVTDVTLELTFKGEISYLLERNNILCQQNRELKNDVSVYKSAYGMLNMKYEDMENEIVALNRGKNDLARLLQVFKLLRVVGHRTNRLTRGIVLQSSSTGMVRFSLVISLNRVSQEVSLLLANSASISLNFLRLISDPTRIKYGFMYSSTSGV